MPVLYIVSLKNSFSRSVEKLLVEDSAQDSRGFQSSTSTKLNIVCDIKVEFVKYKSTCLHADSTISIII